MYGAQVDFDGNPDIDQFDGLIAAGKAVLALVGSVESGGDGVQVQRGDSDVHGHVVALAQIAHAELHGRLQGVAGGEAEAVPGVSFQFGDDGKDALGGDVAEQGDGGAHPVLAQVRQEQAHGRGDGGGFAALAVAGGAGRGAG